MSDLLSMRQAISETYMVSMIRASTIAGARHELDLRPTIV